MDLVWGVDLVGGRLGVGDEVDITTPQPLNIYSSACACMPLDGCTKPVFYNLPEVNTLDDINESHPLRSVETWMIFFIAVSFCRVDRLRADHFITPQGIWQTGPTRR